MQLRSDPSTATKIRRMKQRVRWQEPAIVRHNIDQTRLVFGEADPDESEFSFLAIGDSGTGYHRGHRPQRQIAELLLKHRPDCQFLLHTGDVVYQVGSSEYYYPNFIKPYREFLVGGDNPKAIAYDRMTFDFPILPVPGNHDYYDLPFLYQFVAPFVGTIRHLLRSQVDFDIGRHGSFQGQAYARAFLDCLELYRDAELREHLDRHYRGKVGNSRCLRYEIGLFTRLPNRYYQFRRGGIDFFALDSNTFNDPVPLPNTPEGRARRRELIDRLNQVEREKQQFTEAIARLNPDSPEDRDHLDDLNAKLEQIDEIKLDIEKNLHVNSKSVIDFEQLGWLERGLIESWNTSQVRGRVLYFHHPPYVTEATKWNQAQTLAVRHRLRAVLNAVAEAIGDRNGSRPVVDLVLNGHAHCLEHLYTRDTGSADSHIHWIVCGGSGYSLRRQRPEGPELEEAIAGNERRVVAESRRFVGRSGHGKHKRRPYSGLRIDVQSGCPPKFLIYPLVAERIRGEWHFPESEPFVVGGVI